MRFVTLDHIVRSVLLKQGKTIHWYFKYVKLASDCFRELNYDVLKPIQSNLFTLSETGSFTLPDGYIDWLKIGKPIGQSIRPYVRDTGINRLNNRDANGLPIRYTDTSEDTQLSDLLCSEVLCNGSQFGHRQSSYFDGFKELRERCEIQMGEGVTGQVYMEWLSDGGCNAATRVDPLAQTTIEDWIVWKEGPNANNEYSPEGRIFDRSLKKLWARKAGWTTDAVKRAINRNKIATNK